MGRDRAAQSVGLAANTSFHTAIGGAIAIDSADHLTADGACLAGSMAACVGHSAIDKSASNLATSGASGTSGASTKDSRSMGVGQAAVRMVGGLAVIV